VGVRISARAARETFGSRALAVTVPADS